MLVRFLVYICLAVFFTALVPTAQAQDVDDPSPPAEVTVGLYINDIQAIDLRTHSYGMDFYLWFRWQENGIDPTQYFEFMNTFDPEAHVQTVLYDEPQPQPDGSLYQVVRHQGLFSAKFPVARYPFDKQTLMIALEDADNGADELRYIPDATPITLNPEIRLPGYRIGAPRLTIRDKPYPTAFGDLGEPDQAAYSRAEFIVPISRPALSGVFKALVPVFLIILCAAFSLMLDPVHVEARIGLAVTALLTLVAMQFTMLSGLPEVAYLTLIDQIFLASYSYILLVIGVIVRGTRTDQHGDIRSDREPIFGIAESGPITALAVTGLYLAAIAVIMAVDLL